MRVDVEHLAEMLLEAVRAVARAVAQAGDAHAFRQRAQIRQPGGELAVDDRQAHARRARSTRGDQRRRLRERSRARARNFASAIGATFVKRQSSCRVVGKPTSANRFAAAARGVP